MATTSTTVIGKCHNCGSQQSEGNKFCTGCGMSLTPAPSYDTRSFDAESHHQAHAAARGFAQAFGLHPILALFTIVVDAMVSTVDVVTVGISIPVLWVIASMFTFVIVYLGQKKWMGDDEESSAIKALIVAFLTALPTPLPAFLTIPSGIAGIVALRRKGQ